MRSQSAGATHGCDGQCHPGGLLGGAASCAAGATIGAPIDRALPDNFLCQACGYAFDGDLTDPALT